VLRFLVSPVAILGDERVEAVEIVRNELVEEDGRIVARPTGATETIPCGLVLRSVGYQGVALPGVPFDERRGVVPNTAGRVDGAERTYAAGWIKRGPSGVIGTNKKDATETVELLLEDLRDAPRKGRTADEVDALLLDRGVRLVVYSGWASIDELERTAGEKLGRPRVKLCTWDELLTAAENVAKSGA
jgi:ferredoxin--NADP+ reductase